MTEHARARKTVHAIMRDTSSDTMTDLREALAHVIWIGGGPMVGKSTLAGLLAEKHSLTHYDLDEHGVSEHRRRPGEATLRFEELTMDERWLGPGPTALLERSIAIWSERFALVIEDLLALPRSHIVVAEGPGTLPWLVAPLVRTPQQAIFLVPTTRMRNAVELRRGPGFLARTSDPELAAVDLRARDALLWERITSFCSILGLRLEIADTTRGVEASLARL